MTAKDVAGYLNISLTSGYNLMNAKDFPTLRLGKQLRVSRDHFLNWLNNANEVNFK
jgi:excisionase family DNA binding protein